MTRASIAIEHDYKDFGMDAAEIAKLMLDLETSIQMRQTLHERLRHNESVDLVEELIKLEQLDLVIASRIRKRRPE